MPTLATPPWLPPTALMLALCQPTAAQHAPTPPTPRATLAPLNSFIDLDTGAILPKARIGEMVADVRFDRDGTGLFLEPMHGGQVRGANQIAPTATAWANARIRAPRHGHPPACFLRTDRGVAHVDATILDSYSAATLSLRWFLATPEAARFHPAPTNLARSWADGKLTLTWTDDAPRWSIAIETTPIANPANPGAPRDVLTQRMTVDQPSLELPDLTANLSYRIRISGLREGITSLPAEATVHGQPRPAERGHTDFEGRWHNVNSGLRLAPAAAVTRDADVVFYLYGVYVPGGGVVKLGRGEDAYHHTSRLPTGPHPCVHSRLDADDVLAIELPDGRCAKLWLRPLDGGDLRQGMRVHHTFLADGRRQLQQPPTEVSADLDDGVISVSWPAVPGAARYRVEADGRPPVTTTQTTLRWPALPNRLFEVRLYAESDLGERSAPARVRTHTFGDGARHGTAILKAQQSGIDFQTGEVTTEGPWHLAIVGGAGGAQVLRFRAANRIESAGERGFADFTGLDPQNGKNRWSSDADQAGSDRFYVHTPDGGCASVQILVRDWPNTKIEYLWLPRRR